MGGFVVVVGEKIGSFLVGCWGSAGGGISFARLRPRRSRGGGNGAVPGAVIGSNHCKGGQQISILSYY